MIMDAQNLFSDAQSVVTGSDTGLTSTNVIDLKSAGREIGAGKPVHVSVTVDEAFTSSGNNETLDVNLITDDNESMSSPTVVQKLGTLPAASAIGEKIVGTIAPKPGVALQRYIALQYKTGGDGTALTAGKVTAAIVETADTYKAYDDNVTIS